MKSIQLIQITPEQLQKMIMEGVKIQFDELKKEFQPKQPIEYLSIEETSELLKVTKTTLWRWTKDGILQSYGISNKVYYKRVEVEQAMIKLNK
ncbi:helix-turn-helix domain-containing protein [Aquimarina macrocephali]|uniref:helix-turn-helix domain-containing protein n=1 Tax=Aquimarina macrocephali TaxID=666563 RepID=UPI003F662307